MIELYAALFLPLAALLLPFAGSLQTFAEAAESFPGGPVSLATLHRWRLKGVGGVKLATLKIGGRRFVTRESIADFIAATTAADGEAPPVPTPKQAQREDDATQRELDRLRIGTATNRTNEKD